MSRVKMGLGLVVAAALVVGARGAASAAPAKRPDQAQSVVSGDMTDFSSQRRRGRAVRRGPDPGAAFAGAAIGIIGSAIAAGAARDYYYDRPYYGPGYYRPQPYYGYGPGYYDRW